jgi:hypothetical protein
MKMTGQELIPAARERVWAALNDPQVLKQSVPGCQSITRTSPTAFEATVVAKVGPVKAKFAGNVTLSKLKPPESYVISGQGKGGAAGFAKGNAAIKLSEAEGGTMLSYEVDAQVGGKLAQIGSRLIDSSARKMAGDFFKRFAKLAASDMVIAGEKKPGKAKAKAKPAAKARTATRSTKKTAKVAPPAAEKEAVAAPVAAPQASMAAPAPAAETKSNAWMWLAAAAVVVALIYYFTAS